MSHPHYVIIGCGAAGSHAAYKLGQLEPSATVTVFSKESYPFYHKCDLADFLCGNITKKDLFHDHPDRFIDMGIRLRLSQKVISIDPSRHDLHLSHNERVHYDKLLIATGVRATVHPIYLKFSDHMTLINSLEDVDRLLLRPERLKHPLILGGSLTALRLALALRSKYIPVDYLLLTRMTGNLLAGANDFDTVRGLLLENGVTLFENMGVEEIVPSGKELMVLFSNGIRKKYTIIFGAFGVTPNINLAKGANIPCEQGVLVNECFETNMADVYAAGDMAQIYNPSICDYWVNFGWYNAVTQGEIAAMNMCGQKTIYDPERVNIFEIYGDVIHFSNWQ